MSAAASQAWQLAQAGQTPAAVQMLRSTLATQPDADAAYLLGVLLSQQRDFPGAAQGFHRATELRPDWAEARQGLGTCLYSMGRGVDAIGVWQEAARLKPDLPGLYHSMVIAAMQVGRYDEVARFILDAAERLGDPAEVVSRFITDVIYSGRSGLAVAAVREAMRRAGPSLALRRAMALPILYWEGASAEEIAAELRALGAELERAFPEDPRPLANVRDPGRKLRVGYVSQDFRSKAAGHFIEPVIMNHDPERFEVVCYSTSVTPADDLTARIRPRCAKWMDIAHGSGLHYGPLADVIRADGIDILVDLVGHPPLNALASFARRGAPVQITYLGYPATTGLSRMDYRLIDGWTDPSGHERYASETLIRLEPCFLCYAPPPWLPAVSAVPSAGREGVTFGSFNTAAKIEPSVIRAWSRLVRSVPGSRLVLKNQALGSASVAGRYRELFAAEGVAGPRLVLRGETRSKAEHLAAYGEIDIALDPFPYNGTTTTVEALVMGVPVVTFAGDRHEARVGLSLLRAVGLPELVGESAEDAMRIAGDLARDPARLAGLRGELRGRVLASPLCDGAGFTRRLEAVYRTCWERWCGGK